MGNDTIDNLNAIISASQTIDVTNSDYNNAVVSFNATMEQLILQNQTYAETLESGNQDEIEAAQHALDATFFQLVS